MEVEVRSNIEEVHREVRIAFQRFPSQMARAHAENARTIREAADVELDVLVYGSPPSDEYVRTYDLMKGNKVAPISEFAWLLHNDVEYSGYVHDGTSQMEARPWMANAVDLVQEELDDNLLRTGTELFESGIG